MENVKNGNADYQSSDAQGANDKDNQNLDTATSIIPEKGEPSGVGFGNFIIPV